MTTKVLKIDAQNPQSSKIEEVVALLDKGAVVALPTETVYGLAVCADNEKALDKLYEVKRRPNKKQFTIQIPDLSQIDKYIDNLSPALEVILREFWPGPLTVIVKSGDKTTGLRIPDNRVTLSILEAIKRPLAVTSANISGEQSVSSAEEVKEIFDNKIEMIVDDQARADGIESTVLDCTTPHFKIVREGAISEKLNRFLKIYG